MWSTWYPVGRGYQSGTRRQRSATVRRAWRWLHLRFCQYNYDDAMRRGDLADANYWQQRKERVAGW
jgi:hypothetical protein